MSALALTRHYVFWKLLLLALIALSPGPGYDTSTALIASQWSHSRDPVTGQQLSLDPSAALGQYMLLQRLVRWDGVYFTTAAQHGFQLEQQWAFGWGFSSFVGIVTSGAGASGSIAANAAVAIVVNLAAHLASVLVLYQLCLSLFGSSTAGKSRASLIAHLHIIAPAGVFLIAPSGESLFALLSFVGAYCYLRGLQSRCLWSDLNVILAGLSFGLACTMRGNGVLNGLVFAVDLALTVWRCRFTSEDLRFCCALALGGLLVAAGFAFPQALAYMDYCWPKAHRPWCTATIPSIFNFVQKYYWNVGPFKYWTLSNAPLFLLALPMTTLMLASAWFAISRLWTRSETANSRRELTDEHGLMWRLALPQGLLAMLTLTNFHVQIITRIASGYILPYVLVAQLAERKTGETGSGKGLTQATVKWMVMYGIVQAGLYSAFLPPA